MLQGEQCPMGDITLVALGSNVASRVGPVPVSVLDTVTAALEALGHAFGKVTASRFYSTPAFPAGAGPDFVNAACAFVTPKSAPEILQILHRIEAGFGRTRTRRWGERTLDLDLIAHGDSIAPDLATFDHWRSLPPDVQHVTAPDQLILPHPRLQDRSFVLVPLVDVAPDWRHPVLGQTIQQLYDARPRAEIATVRALKP